MNWKKTLLVGLVLGIPGLAYLAWKSLDERKAQEKRRKIAALAEVAHCDLREEDAA